MRLGKRGGITGYVFENLSSLILSIFLILAIIAVVSVLLNAFFLKEKCDNLPDWQSIKHSLNLLESNIRPTVEAPFYNHPCALAGFTKGQFFTLPPGDPSLLTEQPQLCLCEIKNRKCKPRGECYLFSKIKEVRLPLGGQVSSVGLKPHLFIRFERHGPELIVSFIGETQSEAVYEYITSQEGVSVEPEGSRLIKKISIHYSDPEPIKIRSIKVNERAVVYPAGASIVEGAFPLFFEIKLTGEEGKEINKDSIKRMDIEVYLKLNNFIQLEEKGIPSENLNLFSLNENEWTSKPLKCEKQTENVEEELVRSCTASINGFSERFALAPRKEEEHA